MKKIDVLVAEIGSTTTLINAFMLSPKPSFIGQGAAPTTVAADVRTGLNNAIDALSENLGEQVEYDKMLATSSAAGGLRMTVHGLVYDMTVKAGREAALGAGANIHMTTAGILDEFDLNKIEKTNPNLILLAGGTDYGEKETALTNAELLAKLENQSPIIYCGNVQNSEKISHIFSKTGRKFYITENVYPKLDELNVEPVRTLIHQAFEAEITEAPGMTFIREMVTGKIMPTPGAVMESAKILHKEIGDLIVIDVGGATTDIHSVSEGNEDIARIQITPEPTAKRTVEGDLGVYVNAANMCDAIGHDELEKEISLPIEPILENYKPIPQTTGQLKLTTALTWRASSQALKRHVGTLRHTYGSTGRQTYAQGKDLTMVKYLVATGGALTRLPERDKVLERLVNLNQGGLLLYPAPGTIQILEDKDYILASLGVLHSAYPEETIYLMKKSLNIE